MYIPPASVDAITNGNTDIAATKDTSKNFKRVKCLSEKKFMLTAPNELHTMDAIACDKRSFEASSLLNIKETTSIIATIAVAKIVVLLSR
ncbi:MAG: hypothetical protein RSC44_05855, partial [Clostridia bacterium]